MRQGLPALREVIEVLRTCYDPRYSGRRGRVRISVRPDGVVVSLFVGTRSRNGYIGLQAHHPGAHVRFRNLEIKPR